MKPYYEQDGITIYHGDCREILPTLPKVDLVLTDPPYGHGSKWSGGTWAANEIYDMAFEWDASTVEQAVIDNIISLGNTCVIWGGNYYSLPPSRCWLAWEKSSKMPTMADFELAWTNLDRPSKQFREDRNPDGRRYHPTQKPISVISWCISLAGEVKTALDPFMGSGTTLVACKRAGIKCTGIEREERYCEIAAKRLAQGVLWGAE
jgi:DNA modification methylase